MLVTWAVGMGGEKGSECLLSYKGAVAAAEAMQTTAAWAQVP